MSEDNKANRINKTTYETKYPYNQCTIFECGHEVHYDNTPGKERIRIAHKHGSYIEMSADGKIVQYTVGNKQEYNKGGVTVTIDENQDMKVHGHARINVSGGQ